jgi:hypothetical protein
MRSIQIAILGIAIGFIHTMFFGDLNETFSTVLNAATLLLIFVGIVGLFKNRV